MELFVLFLNAILFCVLSSAGARTWSVTSTKFSRGDLVQISSDEQLITELHSQGIGFSIYMKPTLGKIGRIGYIDSYGDLYTDTCNTTWFYSAKAVTKLASAGDSGPEVSSDCVYSRATIDFQQTNIGKTVILDCTVADKTSSSNVRLVKGDRIIYEENSFDRPEFDIIKRIEGSLEIFTLQINNVKPEGLGWYTCKLVDRDGQEAAVGVVKVARTPGYGVGETSSPHPDTGTATEAAGGEFVVGDVVQVLSDEDRVKELHERGYTDEWQKTLGKIGIVDKIHSEGYPHVTLCGYGWYYHPRAVTKLASAGISTPKTSSSCAYSKAKIDFNSTRIGNSVSFKCTVTDKDPNSNVRLMKGDRAIFLENSFERPAFEVTKRSEGSSEIFTLKIRETKSEDEGWYACEVRRGRVAATAGVKLEVGEARTSPGGTGAIEVLHPETETKPDAAEESFEEDDVVRVLSDEATVRGRFGSLGFPGAMRDTLGKFGRVIRRRLIDDIDVYTNICGTTWWYKPNTIVKVASAGSSSAPDITSDCVWSDSTISISEQRSGDSLNLTCTVLNKLANSHVSWKKEGTRISHDSFREDSRITLHSDYASKKLIVQIDNVKPEDAGWYTCEVMTDGEVAATAVEKIEAHQLQPVITEVTVTDDKIVKGDLVMVLRDKEKGKELKGEHRGWNDAMKEPDGPTAPSGCVDCAALSAIEEKLQHMKYLIANSTSELLQLRSKLNDVSERLEMVEHRVFTHAGDA